MQEAVLALDLGGTNTRVAKIDRAGNIIKRQEASTPSGGSADDVLGLIAKLASDCGTDGVLAMGAAVPATFRRDGSVGKLPNLPMLDGINISTDLSGRLGIPVKVFNDATAATEGEHWLGASAGASNVIGITLGTGVGGGLIFNGKVFFGPDGTAGEIGHMCVEPDGRPCPCGSHGCIEQYASGTAIVRSAKERCLDVDSPYAVYELAENGNEIAADVFTEMGRYLGITLGSLVNALNPEVITIGGGVAAAWDRFIDALQSEVRLRAFNEPIERVNIIRAKLGDDAGLLGSASIVFGRDGA
ncbi:MAG: ROK family protein [Chloracidobacterium sp.]|nr:ROK family protein [Chloracidobacterium sp.]MCC6824906.1 ROK family protein [Acidobacteriota bacterium]MCO5333580.1 ROK family protein [Pyrinomonadaceae bacterium]